MTNLLLSLANFSEKKFGFSFEQTTLVLIACLGSFSLGMMIISLIGVNAW